MTTVLTYIFILAGLQGIFLFVLLFVKNQNRSANRILGTAILFLSIDLFLNAAVLNKVYVQHPHLLGINYAFPFLYGPLFYLYIRALTAVDRKADPRKLLHFIPYFIVILYMLPDLLLNADDKLAFVLGLMKKEPLGYAIFNHLKPVHGIIYTVLTIKLANLHNCRIKDSFSNIDKINLRWFKNITTWLVVVWGVVVLSFIIEDFLISGLSHFDGMIYFFISIMVYTIGYKGLRQPEIFNQSLMAFESEQNQKIKIPLLTENEISSRLSILMETEKPYLLSELTLKDLSDKMNIPQNKLREVIKKNNGETFFDFVNRYRVEEFKKKLETPETFNFNLLTIAIESGFGSKNSFNEAFRAYTNMSPSQYRAALRHNRQNLKTAL